MRYGKLYEEGVKRLQCAGVEEAESDCFILFSEAFSLGRSTFFFKKNEEIPASAADRIERFFSWLSRRERHEPVQYIIGNQEFYGLTFQVNSHVLIPRLDTEVLVEEILKEETAGKSVLDLCTGSGCILISLMKCGGFLRGAGTDISGEALTVAEQNAVQNGVQVQLLQGDLFGALDGLSAQERRFDVIVSNPPYIAEAEKPDLAPEVLEHEPSLALFAGHEGLLFYERILAEASGYLTPHGTIYFEIGCTQAEAVKELCEKNGFGGVQVIRDLAGLDRVVKACMKG
jgi:release factor glutamine methyltransferase